MSLLLLLSMPYAPNVRRPLAMKSHVCISGFQAGELRLYFQPQVSLDSGRFRPLEVLLRWHHPERGLHNRQAKSFHSRRVRNDRRYWHVVLLESCAQLACWNEMGLRGVRLAVNVSALQIHKSDFVDIMDKALRINQIAPGLCEIEITESTPSTSPIGVNVLGETKRRWGFRSVLTISEQVILA